MQVRKQQLELDMGQQTVSKSGKEYVKVVYCYPAYLTYIQSSSWEILDWMNHKLESRLLGEIPITSRYADDTTLMAENKEEPKSILMNMKDESEKVGLKLNIQKTKIMASGPIASWQIGGETVADFFWGLQNHCRWWLQPWNLKMLVPWKKGYDQPRQHIKKQRYYFANKGPSSQSFGFSSSHVWMWELDYKEESWAPKNWCFWTVVLEQTREGLQGNPNSPF